MITRTIPHDNSDRLWRIDFEHESASANIVILEDDPHFAYLFDVYSHSPRQGHASAMLQEIDAYCKQNQIFLVIEAIWHEGEPGSITDSDTLRAFYEKSGAIFLEQGKYGPNLYMGTPKE